MDAARPSTFAPAVAVRQSGVIPGGVGVSPQLSRSGPKDVVAVSCAQRRTVS